MTDNNQYNNQPPFDEPPPPSDDDYYDIDPFSEGQGGPVSQPVDVKSSDRNKKDVKKVYKKKDKEKKPQDLENILKTIFHFDSFRPYQKRVCEFTIDGRDCLLVMPTGSGKSLCYQLPGIAMNGTTLVVSPLIALMEDQVAGLKEQSLKAERIHSGRTRAHSRQVCRDYLDGDLDFLFIAPERLAVPGFPEMLARRKPVLIAIDEAHCISQWGHDFRPDYRLLGQRLPILKPAPVIAMTATATPRVQDDIIRQLGINGAELCIHGFRRTNIAIELIELLPSERTHKVIEILQKNEARPAIIYAPTRQKTEDLAKELKGLLSVAPYHAGLSSEIRDKVQTAFLAGELDAIVATIAFGMGIDKPDIRTVIHTALPASLEGYYQEIGRAGRDGEASRAILLHSYGDRKVHEFLHGKNYPPEALLRRIYRMLKEEKIQLETLRDEFSFDEEEFDAAIEKLWIHGGALIDSDDTVRQGQKGWHITYNKQSNHRLSQIDEMARFANSFSCRMLYLISHFGDREDKGMQCGICDYCSPDTGTSSMTRKPDLKEETIISEILSALKSFDSLGTGKLYNSVCPGSAMERSDFENLLRSLVREGVLILSEHSFEKDGDIIHYKRAELTNKGYSIMPGNIPDIKIMARETTRAGLQKRHKKRKAKKPVRQKPSRSVSIGDTQSKELYEALRKWRAVKAKKKGVPAFRVFSNKVLENLVADLPTTDDELLMISGVGPYFCQNYGAAIIKIVREYLS